MKNKRRSRELIIQILYSNEFNQVNLEKIFTETVFVKTPDRYRKYTQEIVFECLNKKPRLDQIIEKNLKKWSINRISLIDKVILYMSICELMKAEIPCPVVIDEALELTKKFSGTESVKFVNGILDKINMELNQDGKRK